MKKISNSIRIDKKLPNLVISLSGDYIIQKSLDFETVPKNRLAVNKITASYVFTRYNN